MNFADAMSWDTPKAAPDPRRGGGNPAPGSAIMSAAQQMVSDESEFAPNNVADLQGAIRAEKNPQARATLQTELTRLQGAANEPAGQFSDAMSWPGSVVPRETLRLANKPTVTTEQPSTLKSRVMGSLQGESAGDQVLAAGETALAAGSGLGATILGGLHGLYKLATTGSTDQAADAVRSTQGALTYQPIGEKAKGAVETLGSGQNPLNWLPMAGKAIAEKGVDTGVLSPGVAATIEAGSALAGPGGALKLGQRAMRGGAAETLGKAAETAGEAKPYGSVGSSATARASGLEADLASATPELRKAVSLVKETELNPEALARQLEADSLPVPLRLTKGQATQDVGLLSHEQNIRGKSEEMRNRFNEQSGQLLENVNAIREKAAPDVYGTNHVENGQALIDAYKATDDALRTDISAKYKALEDANGGKFPVDGVAFVDAAEAALQKALKSEFVPAPIARQMEKFKDGAPMTFEQFEAMRTNLAAEMRKAERSGDGNAAYAAGVVRDALESLPMTGDAAALKPIADSARAAAKARFDLLKKDPAYKAAVNDAVAPDDFINKFVVKGKSGDVATMVEHLGKDSVAHQTMAAGVINYLKSRAGIVNEAGIFSQAGYNKALQELKPKLLTIVGHEAAKQIETLGNVARYTQAQPRGSFVNNSNTLVGSMAEGAKNIAEGTANRVLGLGVVPVGSLVREAAAKRATTKEVMNSLQTGAGISLKDVGKK